MKIRGQLIGIKMKLSKFLNKIAQELNYDKEEVILKELHNLLNSKEKLFEYVFDGLINQKHILNKISQFNNLNDKKEFLYGFIINKIIDLFKTNLYKKYELNNFDSSSLNYLIVINALSSKLKLDLFNDFINRYNLFIDQKKLNTKFKLEEDAEENIEEESKKESENQKKHPPIKLEEVKSKK